MISYIKGKIILKKEDYVILESMNIGFKVFVNYDVGRIGEEVSLFTYLNVKEDSLTLFGFKNHEELELFEILISVSGIGPRSGMGILAMSDSNTIKTAIASEDASLLTKVPGIGKKTAERVILELKNKFSLEDIVTDESTKNVVEHSDAIEALVGLGYSRNEVQKTLAEIPKDKKLEEKIRLALKALGK